MLIFRLLFQVGAARVQRFTSTTAPGFTFQGTIFAGYSPLPYFSSWCVRLRRESSPMGMIEFQTIQCFFSEINALWILYVNLNHPIHMCHTRAEGQIRPAKPFCVAHGCLKSI